MLPDNFLNSGTVATDVEVQSKKRLLEIIAEMLSAQNRQLDVTEIFEKLIERERLGSTGLGRGIALPHARVSKLEQAQAVFIRLEQGIDFDAIDRQPVDLVVALLVPVEANEEHLKILAGLAGFFNNADNCDKLRQSDDHQQVIDMLMTGIENPG